MPNPLESLNFTVTPDKILNALEVATLQAELASRLAIVSGEIAARYGAGVEVSMVPQGEIVPAPIFNPDLVSWVSIDKRKRVPTITYDSLRKFEDEREETPRGTTVIIFKALNAAVRGQGQGRKGRSMRLKEHLVFDELDDHPRLLGIHAPRLPGLVLGLSTTVMAIPRIKDARLQLLKEAEKVLYINQPPSSS